jgi:two-component system phosphate regulon sensor histidine kinase PhoR
LYDEEINIEYLKKAAKNADRLQNIVEDLEAISRLESGKEIIELRKFDIKALCQEIFEDLKPLRDEKSTKLVFKEGADKAFQVLADPDAIRQVVNNLVVNSSKYGKQNGCTQVSFYDMHDHVLIEVTDDGIGIQEKHLKHLFDRFYRVDTSRSRNMGGSGLGLSIVKHIIEAHNQTIHVRSTPGIGTTFGFTLQKA